MRPESANPLESDKQAMRAFLQRAEVRLSTMHRIAGSFLSGAGLLILFPVFLNDAAKEIASIFLDQVFPSLKNELFLLAGISIPLLLSILLPLYALSLLLRDIVRFYFAAHSPGFVEKEFYPRFALSAIAFPENENTQCKKRILIREYSNEWVNFILPQSQKAKLYYDQVSDKMREVILPPTRTSGSDSAYADVVISGSLESLQDPKDLERFNLALGQAGLLDRDLEDEVAKMEVSLSRHNLYLRRLVLRYAKALMLFIWTTLFSFMLLMLLNPHGSVQPPRPFAISIGYIIWAVLTPFVVMAPVRWIFSLADQNLMVLRNVRRDPDLVHFENLVMALCWSSAIFLIVTAIFYWV